MLVLSLDTTTKTLSCALARDGVVVSEGAGDAAGAHATQLPGELMALLAASRVELAEVDLFAVATGPGSFTGLRIGIATMQGLAFATRKPLVGVSGFDALARLGGPERVATWVNAWRGEVYAALYEGGAEVTAPHVAPPDALLSELGDRPTLFIGDGAESFRALIVATMNGRARFGEPTAPALAGVIAQLAAEQGELPPPHAIRPLYVRRPDVELARNRVP